MSNNDSSHSGCDLASAAHRTCWTSTSPKVASICITADIYGHVSPETNRQAADAMAKALR